MRFMMLVKENEESEAGVIPQPEVFEAMGKYNEELVKAGVMLAGDGLLPSSKGFRIKFDDDKQTVTDGPFAETKELLAGFWIIQVKSREEALEWARRVPFGGGAELEVRQIAELEDFADAMPQQEVEREQALIEELSKRANS